MSSGNLRRACIGLLIVFFCACSLLGCNRSRSGGNARPGKVRPGPPQSSAHLGEPAGGGNGSGGLHPYGRPLPAGRPLPWEKETRFQRRLEARGQKIRMAAFQTTLPDPLPGEEANVALAADLLAGQTVQSGASFSLNRAIGPYRRERGYRKGPAYLGDQVRPTYGGGVCKIASTLYNVVILANLPVLERHAHGMPVPYVPPGQDATVADGAKDFRFVNNTPGPLLIWADTQGNTLYLAFYGQTDPPRVSWQHRVLQRRPTRTVYRYNRRVQPGMSRLVIPGAEGLIVRSALRIVYRDGRREYRQLGTDVYQPLPRVIEINPQNQRDGAAIR